MLGLILIYFIGKSFYTLAETYHKNQWLYAILGVVSYYVGTFIAGIFIGLYYELYAATSLEDMSDIALGLIALPFGLLACWGFYTLLKKQWEKNLSSSDGSSMKDILDDDLLK